MATLRKYHTAKLLNNGKVLAVRGLIDDVSVTETAEPYFLRTPTQGAQDVLIREAQSGQGEAADDHPAIESIRDARFLSDEDKRNILRDNARRLLRIAN